LDRPVSSSERCSNCDDRSERFHQPTLLYEERAAATAERQRRVAGRSPALRFVHGTTRAHSLILNPRQQQQQKRAAAKQKYENCFFHFGLKRREAQKAKAEPHK
jgi:hypothetical protein